MPKIFKLLLGITAISLIFAAPAWAFKETTVGQEQPVAVEKQLKDDRTEKSIKLPDGMSLSTSDEHAATLEKTFEFQIPGLGEKGVLPKLNFGLELLYSAKDQQTVDQQTGIEDSPADDVTIRGTLKHRF